jgi:hypothetical protein
VCGHSDDGDGIGRCMPGQLSVEGAMDSLDGLSMEAPKEWRLRTKNAAPRIDDSRGQCTVARGCDGKEL